MSCLMPEFSLYHVLHPIQTNPISTLIEHLQGTPCHLQTVRVTPSFELNLTSLP